MDFELIIGKCRDRQSIQCTSSSVEKDVELANLSSRNLHNLQENVEFASLFYRNLNEVSGSCRVREQFSIKSK